MLFLFRFHGYLGIHSLLILLSHLRPLTQPHEFLDQIMLYDDFNLQIFLSLTTIFTFFSFPDIASLLGDRYGHLLNLYESLMLRRLLATDPDTRWCPRPNCTFAVIATGCASCPRIECEKPGCGYSFCYHCKAEWHPNQTCDAARAQRHQKTFRSSSVPFR